MTPAQRISIQESLVDQIAALAQAKAAKHNCTDKNGGSESFCVGYLASLLASIAVESPKSLKALQGHIEYCKHN